MKITTVPLVVYEDGKRKVIGTATITYDGYGNFMASAGSIVDEDYKGLISANLKHLAMFTNKE